MSIPKTDKEIQMKLLCVKTDKGCFISDNSDYSKKNLKVFYFDGEHPISTYCKDWYFVEQYPTSVQQDNSGETVNRRYELKDTTLASDKLPLVIPYEEAENYNDDAIDSLYEYKYDRTEPFKEELTFEIKTLCEVDNFDFAPVLDYSAIHKWHYSDSVYKITNADVQHQLLDKIIFPEVLLHNRPCKLSSKQMYDITRQYILEHIDHAVAEVSSNYDFCFEVRKLIPMIEPEKITYQNIFARTKKERNKIHTTIKKYEKKLIYEMTHDQSKYNNYTVIPEMTANSESELKEKVDTWLEGLIECINKPLCQCPHCQGSGYLDDFEKINFKDVH